MLHGFQNRWHLLSFCSFPGKFSCLMFLQLSTKVLNAFFQLLIILPCFVTTVSEKEDRKLLKKSPRAYIFQRPFLRGLFLEGLIFGGAYLRRKICVSKSIGLAL